MEEELTSVERARIVAICERMEAAHAKIRELLLQADLDLAAEQLRRRQPPLPLGFDPYPERPHAALYDRSED
jgi:hypothetical protein